MERCNRELDRSLYASIALDSDEEEDGSFPTNMFLVNSAFSQDRVQALQAQAAVPEHSTQRTGGHFNRLQGVAALEGSISHGDDCVWQLDDAKRVAVSPGLSTDRVKPCVNFEEGEVWEVNLGAGIPRQGS